MNKSEIHRSLQRKIAKNRINEVFDYLIYDLFEKFSMPNEKLIDDTISLSSKYVRINENFDSGILSWEISQIETLKLVNRLITLINRIPKIKFTKRKKEIANNLNSLVVYDDFINAVKLIQTQGNIIIGTIDEIRTKQVLVKETEDQSKISSLEQEIIKLRTKLKTQKEKYKNLNKKYEKIKSNRKDFYSKQLVSPELKIFREASILGSDKNPETSEFKRLISNLQNQINDLRQEVKTKDLRIQHMKSIIDDLENKSSD